MISVFYRLRSGSLLPLFFLGLHGQASAHDAPTGWKYPSRIRPRCSPAAPVAVAPGVAVPADHVDQAVGHARAFEDLLNALADQRCERGRLEHRTVAGHQRRGRDLRGRAGRLDRGDRAQRAQRDVEELAVVIEGAIRRDIKRPLRPLERQGLSQLGVQPYLLDQHLLVTAEIELAVRAHEAPAWNDRSTSSRSRASARATACCAARIASPRHGP